MGKKAPKAPDPAQTAAAQTLMNQQTALYQHSLNAMDQTNPWGSTTYTQSGMTEIVGPDGKMISVPKWSATTTLSPAQQAIFDQSQAAQNNLATIANQQSGRIQEMMSDPFTFDNQAAADWAYDMGSSRIAPQQEQMRQSLQSQLINSGIRPGTAAYDRELMRLENSQNDQWNQLALQGRGQAFNEALTTRNQPINELTALLGNTQVSNPNAQNAQTPQTQVAGTDYAGLVQQNYQNQLQAHQAKMGSMGGLFGTLANIGMTAATGGFG